MTDNTARSAQRVVETLSAYGNEYVFGIPGGKIDAVFDALHDSGPRLVICRHEQNAALMAAAVGRLTGTPGVALVTSGPGTTNLATGLLTATTEQDPMVAICGAVARADRLKRTHQTMDAIDAVKPFTKHGDIAATLTDLAPRLAGWRLPDAAAATVAEQRSALAAIDEQARNQPETKLGLNPAALCLKIRELVDDDATIACDVGSNYIFMGRHFRAYQPRRLLFSDGQ